MAARKPTKLNAPATVTAIQLAQNGTSTPFKVTDHPITIRINCRSAIRAKMAAASVQKILMVIARLRWHTRTRSSPAAKIGGAGAAATPLKRGSGLTEPFSMCPQSPFRDAASRDHFRLWPKADLEAAGSEVSF